MKKLMNAVTLCALIWTGSAHAGFIGTNVDLELQQTISGTTFTHSTTVPVSGSSTSADLSGINFTINDTSIDFTTPGDLAGDLVLNIYYNGTDQITDAQVMGGATLGSFGADFIQLTNLVLMNSANVDVTFGSPITPQSYLLVNELPTREVPEPMSLDLVVLGLIMLGMMLQQRRHARV